MGNRIVRIILGIVIGIGALAAIYFFALPGSVKHPIEEFIQKTFSKDTYAVAEYYQKQEVPRREINFGDMIANCGGGSSAWVVETIDESEDKSSGTYDVHAYSYKVDISMEHENGQENAYNYTQADLEIRFTVNKKGNEYVTTSYNVYVGEDLMNDFYKEQALDSLAAKAKSKIANDAEQAKKDAATENK